MTILDRIDQFLAKQYETPKSRRFVKREEKLADPSAGGKVQTTIYEIVHDRKRNRTFERRRTAWVLPKVAEALKHRRLATDWIRTFSNYIPLYFVGGFVRDKFLKKVSKDIDVVTTVPIDTVKNTLSQLKIKHHVTTSKQEEILTIQMGQMSVDIASSTAKELVEDLARRDFTINAIAQTPTGQFYDPFNGLDDIKNRVLRSPYSNSRRAFKEDPLRIIRGARFVGDFNLRPHQSVLDAIPETRDGLKNVATERIGREFSQIMQTTHPWKALNFLAKYGVLEYIDPALQKMVGFPQKHPNHKYDVWTHSLVALKKTGGDDLITNLAILFHDVGKPETADEGFVHFPGHAEIGAKIATRVLTRLHFPPETVKRVANLVENHMARHSLKDAKGGALRKLKLKMGEDLGRLMTLSRADILGSAKTDTHLVDSLETKLKSLGETTAPSKKDLSPLDGKQIMSTLGMTPGKDVGRVKQHLSRLVEEDKLAPDDIEGAKNAAAQFASTIIKEIDSILDILKNNDD